MSKVIVYGNGKSRSKYHDVTMTYDNVITWWKKHAGKRFSNLKSQGRLRTELEVWSKNSNIDIIR